jgi:hypothetical protein
MGALRTNSKERPRELRRRVMLPARLRNGAQWADACILNVSSRGLMIQSARAGPEGSCVELRRGDHVIVARVMWRSGPRAGLLSEDRIPVEEIMSLSGSQPLQLVASRGALVERRRHRRASALEYRLKGRAMEFAAIAAIGVALAGGAWSMARQALVKPFAQVSAALHG